MFKTYSAIFCSAAALTICLASLASAAALLTPDEVETLKQIGNTLGKTDWNFTLDPCTWPGSLVNVSVGEFYVPEVACNCTFVNKTVCHVDSISLRGRNLTGMLPKELINLPYLSEIDLSLNYLNGTIPVEWGSLQLAVIDLSANRISGSIPKELGNITTLTNLHLQDNQLSGTIPIELGNLPRLQKLYLNSNNLTGELPGTLTGLSSLLEVGISDNRFVGSIPKFITSWTNLQTLWIQGSGLNGPIPDIVLMTNLIDLRISDLNGEEQSFPEIRILYRLSTLILRNCNIFGVIPPALTFRMENLTMLDLSFNKLTGPIPYQVEDQLLTTEYIYLTGNFLSGQVPEELLKVKNYRDFSYNNFTAGSVLNSSCLGQNSNLFSSTLRKNNSGIDICLRSFRCPKDYYSLHINCGGVQEEDNDKRLYEDDVDAGGPSKFFQSKTNWAFSSTGNFMDNDGVRDTYIYTNTSPISANNSQLYTSARLSPLSLTYYGFCLHNGNYTVNLHFAEIMFTNDTTYTSLGRRVFDIYVQGKLVKRDFNIEEEAGGVNKGISMPFTTQVIDTTLEIRFYWAGKGTTDIPVKGTYGPLISAISVDPNFPVPSQHQNGLSRGSIAGFVVGVSFSISLLLVVLWWKGRLLNKIAIALDLRGLDLHTGSFKLRQIKAATNNFDEANKIGEGGFGSVYKGKLSDGTTIAVKQLSSRSKQGNHEFVNEIGMISALQHPNLVKLYGCCVEGNQLLLVYEYMENNSLARALFGAEEQQLNLDWPTRHNICVGIARGLAYLHEESRLKIVHRDIKAHNVLLDKNLNPKISDFGLAKLDDEGKTHISTRIAGTFGYMAPEYAMSGYLTDKADVYSFGIVLLEIVSGRNINSIRPTEYSLRIPSWLNTLKEEDKLMELLDAKLGSDYKEKEVILTFNIAILCTNATPTARPSMSTIVRMLEQGVVDTIFFVNSDISRSSHTTFDSEGIISTSTDTSGTTLTSSSSNVYPISLNASHVTLHPEEIMSMPTVTDVLGTVPTASTSDFYPITLDTDTLIQPNSQKSFQKKKTKRYLKYSSYTN